MIYDALIESVRAALAGARDQLHQVPGVVGTGITHSAVTGTGAGYQLLVMLENYDPALISQLPSTINGVGVVVQVTGYAVPVACTPPCDASRYRPIRGGSQIQNYHNTGGLPSGSCWIGTLGGFPNDANGNPVILSNNHVIAMDNPKEHIGRVGDQINQPGCASDIIGNLAKWATIVEKSAGTNKVDAAYATVASGVTVDRNNLCNYSIGPTVAPAVGMKVKKVGRTTGCTHGTITAIDITVDCNYCTATSPCIGTFLNQIQTSPNMIAGGDSGSVLVTDDGNNNAVGLLFASSGTGDGTAFGNLMSDVESALGVSFGAAPPPQKYSCSGSPDYACNKDPNGQYNDLQSCQNACVKPGQKYACSGSPDYNCTADPNGAYGSLADCQNACVKPAQKYDCVGGNCVAGTTYADLASCQAACAPPPGQKYDCAGAGNCVPGTQFPDLATCQQYCHCIPLGCVLIFN